MTAILTDGLEARRIAQPMLLAQHSRLANVRISWAFTDAAIPKKLTCGAYAKVGICSPRERYLSSGGGGDVEACDVLIVVNEQLWLTLDDRQKRYWIDDALSHIWEDEDGALTLIEHDISAHSDVIQRQGIPTDAMKFAARVIQRLGAEALADDRDARFKEGLAEGARKMGGSFDPSTNTITLSSGSEGVS